ncbi:hypothetical protein ACW50_05715 [Salmonella enterica subsp. enterica]|nr:hypothetical protein [Salmonella enterica subsp. enterica]EDT9093936.1 hypothetical protein [Salmonella enterica subsp. enterica]
MSLMTWLTGKTLAELAKKGQLIPSEIKLPVYPASHYKKNWYEQGIPHGGVIGLTAIMMTMTWLVSINMVIARFDLHNKNHLELVFFLAVGYIAFLTPSNQLLLKGKRSGVIIYQYALLLAIISVTLATFCTLSSVFMGEFNEVLPLLFTWSLLLSSRLQMNTSFFSTYIYFYRIKRVVLESENASA